MMCYFLKNDDSPLVLHSRDGDIEVNQNCNKNSATTRCTLLNCLFLVFILLKLELLTQFPASNDKKRLLFV